MQPSQDTSVLVTGANSGLGFEAAAQLAAAGHGRVVLACRTLDKAEDARRRLRDRVGTDPFESLAVDVADLASSRAATRELISRGKPFDGLLLNAGLVSGNEMQKSADGYENSLAASLFGHHVMTLELLEEGLLPQGARVVISGSESARNDLAKMMDMELYDFATGEPEEFGGDLDSAIAAFSRGERPELFNKTRYYATAKAICAWWSEAMAQHYGDRLEVFTVSPGMCFDTNAGRNARGLERILMTQIMSRLAPLLGLYQPIETAAGRYVEVLHAEPGVYRNGAMYSSPPTKLVGPIEEARYEHLHDGARRDAAWRVLLELTGTGPHAAP